MKYEAQRIPDTITAAQVKPNAPPVVGCSDLLGGFLLFSSVAKQTVKNMDNLGEDFYKQYPTFIEAFYLQLCNRVESKERQTSPSI